MESFVFVRDCYLAGQTSRIRLAEGGAEERFRVSIGKWLVEQGVIEEGLVDLQRGGWGGGKGKEMEREREGSVAAPTTPCNTRKLVIAKRVSLRLKDPDGLSSGGSGVWSACLTWQPRGHEAYEWASIRWIKQH